MTGDLTLIFGLGGFLVSEFLYIIDKINQGILTEITINAISVCILFMGVCVGAVWIMRGERPNKLYAKKATEDGWIVLVGFWVLATYKLVEIFWFVHHQKW